MSHISVFRPNIRLHRVFELEAEVLIKMNIKALLLDVDNTLTQHDSYKIDSRVKKWVYEIQKSGIKLILVSNNTSERVKPFAKKLNLPYIACSMKPLTKGFRQAIKQMCVEKEYVMVVGDQLLTDILGGNLLGCRTVLVEPMSNKETKLIRFKRKIEKFLLK